MNLAARHFTCTTLLTVAQKTVLPAGTRLLCTAGQGASELSLAQPAYMMWGANTGVGKTLISAGIAFAAARAQVPLLYLKPVQTGFPESCDASLVAACAGGSVAYGAHAAELHSALPTLISAAQHATVIAQTLFAWQAPASPHTAVALEGRAVPDEQLRSLLHAKLNRFAAQHAPQTGLALVETAGGVASPTPAGTLQCDAYRPLRLPGVLVGDGRLGGISATISAYESLLLRSYDTAMVVLMEGGPLHQNAQALRAHFGAKVPIVSLPACPEPPGGSQPVHAGSAKVDAELQAWLQRTRAQFDGILSQLQHQHQQRVDELDRAAATAQQVLWWPFTQHASLTGPDRITVIDSRCGEEFAVYQGQHGQQARLAQQYDACASWWTQGMSAELQPHMVEAVAYAAARYGHVIFPETAHKPATELAQLLLQSVGKGWADRVFYTDDGSTAIEVALKMAFRKFMVDHGMDLEADSSDLPQLRVLGLQNGYHGDTLGAMDAVAPSPFNGPKQTPWYSGRGIFLEPPTIGMSNGSWQITLPGDLQSPELTAALPLIPTRDAIFAEDRDQSELYRQYLEHISGQLLRVPGAGSGEVAACILEPVLQGAGGMVLVDPLFQRAMVRVCKAHRIPVIFDEVFSGLWRLGRVSAAEILHETPDIACCAKLLTGGMVPLAATLATKAVFDAFQGPSKLDALLHGHSYSGHPIGCSAGVAALQIYADPSANPSLCAPGSDGCKGTCVQVPQCKAACGRLIELWDEAAVAELSMHPRIQRCFSLGTVFAAELVPSGDGGGYAAGDAQEVVRRLRPLGVYARPLGNVVYLMCTPTTDRSQCSRLLGALRRSL